MSRVNSRRKGINGELEAAKILTSMGFPARRSQQHAGAIDAADILVPRFEQLSLFPEVKRCEQLRLGPWFDQAQKDIRNDHGEGAQRKLRPVIMHRRNKEPWLITMEAEDFLNLINELDRNFSDGDNAEIEEGK